MGNKVVPMAKMRVWYPGQGDPVLTDPGFYWYDVLRETWKYGEVTRTAQGYPHLEYVEDIGLVNKPYVIWQHTQPKHYRFSGGVWEGRYPLSGLNKKMRLCQVYSAPNRQWSATSRFSLPKNPHFAFTFLLDEVANDHDIAQFPPKIRFEFGGGEWCIEFDNESGCRLMRMMDNILTLDARGVVVKGRGWAAVMDLGGGSPPQFGMDVQEVLVIVRCMRGAICISMDGGHTYQTYRDPRYNQWAASNPYYADPTNTPIVVNGGPFTIRGRGRSARFGFHQIKYYTGSYVSPPKRTFQDRGFTSPNFTARYTTPAGTGVTISSMCSGDIAQYKATLVPVGTGSSPFTFYTCPELYAVRMHFPTKVAASAGKYYDIVDVIESVDIEKPYALDAASASVVCRSDVPKNQYDLAGAYPKWQKVQITLGHMLDNGSTEGVVAFTGYVQKLSVAQEKPNKQQISYQIDNVSIRAKRQEWDDFTAPLGGQTVNQALTEVVLSMGLSTDYCRWDPIGDTILLPLGTPEEPFLWPKAGENKWQTLETIAKFAGLELAVSDDGAFVTVPILYYRIPSNPIVWYSVAPNPDTNLAEGIKRISFTFDSTENYTAVLVKGEDLWGYPIWRAIVDVQAESNIASARYAPWRELYIEHVNGKVNAAMLERICVALAREKLLPKYQPELESQVRLDVNRRDLVQVKGTKVGILDNSTFMVLTLKHSYRADPTFQGVTTVAGLRRLT